MKRFSLTGIDIAHSRSPQLFEAAYHGKYAYELMPASTAEEAFKLYEERGLSGMNVTMPFKETIIPYVDVMNEDVKNIAAANIVIRRENLWVAHNSDIDGAIGPLREAGLVLQAMECLVLGWGGAARAATTGLLKAGARVTVANRTINKVKRINNLPPFEILSLDDALIYTEKYKVLINALPVVPGLADHIRLYPHQVLLEADYTLGALQEVAHNAGTQYLSGLQWLLHQAMPAFRLFTGEEPDVEAMQAVIPITPEYPYLHFCAR